MPVRKDEAGRRWVEMELLVPGSPEQVWAAMATGQGNAGWFTKGEIEEKVGGTFRLDFGDGMSSSGEVTFWEPPRRFGYVEHGWAEDAPPVATEIIITGRAGDKCVVRMVHSLFASNDDWDGQLEGFEDGWVGFFAVLRIYLRHFAGQPAAPFMAVQAAGSDLGAAWRKILDRLGWSGANVGEGLSAGDGAEQLSGIVEYVHQDGKVRSIIVRIDNPKPGVALVAGYEKAPGVVLVTICRFTYGSDAATHAAKLEPRWRAWLAETFPAAG